MEAQANLFPDDEAQPSHGTGSGTRTGDTYSDPITLKVEVLVPPQILVASSGKEFAKFAARDLNVQGRGTFAVVCFKGSVANAKKLKVGDKITITGKNDEKSETGFIVWGIHVPGEKKAALSPKARIIREYGSLEAYREVQRKEREYHVAAGRVLVKKQNANGTEWLNRDDCCEHNDEWKKKIVALMDEYGGEIIGNEIRAIISGSPKIDLERDASGFSLPRASWVDKYNAWLNERVRVMLGLSKPELFP